MADDPIKSLEEDLESRIEQSSIEDAISPSPGPVPKREKSDHQKLVQISVRNGLHPGESNYDSDTRYRPPFEENRDRVIVRDDFRCQFCGMDYNRHLEEYGCELHVHHITPPEVIEDNQLAQSLCNLITVCNGCHSRVEKLDRLEVLKRCRNPENIRTGGNDD